MGSPLTGYSPANMPLDEIPIPTAQQIAAPPSAPVNPAPEMPRGAGFAGKGAGIASIATNFMNGWMAGIDRAEEQKRKAATTKIQATRATFDMAAAQWKKMQENGLDPETIAKQMAEAHAKGDQATIDKLTPQAKQVEEAHQVLTNAWGTYVDTMGQYSIPVDDKGQPIKKGIGGKIKGALTAQDPQIYPAMAIGLLKKMDPVQIANMSGPEKSALQEQKSRQELIDQQLKSTKTQVAEQDQVHILRDQRTAALAKGDSKAVDNIDSQLAGFGVKVEEPIAGARELAQQEVQLKTSAYAALNSGKTINDLTAGQQVAVGIPPLKDPYQAYMSEVGPGKRFKTPYDAAHKYLDDEHAARVMGREPTASEDIRRSVQVTAQHDWEQAGNKGPVPQWKVEEDFQSRMKPDYDDKHPNGGGGVVDATTRETLQDKAIRQIRAEHKDEPDVMDNFFVQDPESGQWKMRENPTEPESHWFGEPTYPGKINKSEMGRYETTVRGQMRAHLQKLYPKATPEQLDQVLGAPVYNTPEGGVKNPPKDAGSPAAGKPAVATTAQASDPNDPVQTYAVQLPDGSPQRQMKKSQADALRARGVHVTLMGSTP
jgi:hypothetical protein